MWRTRSALARVPWKRRRSDMQAQPRRERVWTAAARFDAVLTTAAMDDEAGKNA
ncbi:MAG: hypothetical protein K2Y13_04715 [Burkholderiaceae bacterium]|nr:hypothetical protein [Burkholderiaceae bacterium]